MPNFIEYKYKGYYAYGLKVDGEYFGDTYVPKYSNYATQVYGRTPEEFEADFKRIVEEYVRPREI